MYVYIIYIYIYIYTYIHVCIHTVHMEVHLRTEILDFGGCDSSRTLILGWNSQMHRGVPGRFESANLSRDNLSREIRRNRHRLEGQLDQWIPSLALARSSRASSIMSPSPKVGSKNIGCLFQR